MKLTLTTCVRAGAVVCHGAGVLIFQLVVGFTNLFALDFPSFFSLCVFEVLSFSCWTKDQSQSTGKGLCCLMFIVLPSHGALSSSWRSNCPSEGVHRRIASRNIESLGPRCGVALSFAVTVAPFITSLHWQTRISAQHCPIKSSLSVFFYAAFPTDHLHHRLRWRLMVSSLPA